MGTCYVGHWSYNPPFFIIFWHLHSSSSPLLAGFRGRVRFSNGQKRSLVGGLEPWKFMTFRSVVVMSSSQLAFTRIFFRGVGSTSNQASNHQGDLTNTNLMGIWVTSQNTNDDSGWWFNGSFNVCLCFRDLFLAYIYHIYHIWGDLIHFE